MDFQKGSIEFPPKPEPILDQHHGELIKLAARINKLEEQMTDVLSRLANSAYLNSHVLYPPRPPKNEELD